MRAGGELHGSVALIANDVPGEIVGAREGWAILAPGSDPVSMPMLEDDPFRASFVLADDPLNRDGEVLWEISINRDDRVVALAALSEALAGPEGQFYTIALDKIFVHPDYRNLGIGRDVVGMMAEVFETRIARVLNVL